MWLQACGGDSPASVSRQEWPCLINRRCSTRARAITEAIHESGKFEGLSFFVSNSTPIAGHEVHTCVGIPTNSLKSVPIFNNPLKNDYYGSHIEESFVQAIINTCLIEADKSLYLPNPGHDRGILGDHIGVVRTSAARFGEGIAFALTPLPRDLFRIANEISSLTYERAGARGHFVVTKPDNLVNKLTVTFKDPVRLNQTRSARKVLELTEENTTLLIDGNLVYGLGQCNSAPDVAKILIDGHARWSLSVDNTTLMKVNYEHATLPKQIIDRDHFADIAERTVGAVDVERIWKIFQCALDNNHGTTIVISAEPNSEVERLPRNRAEKPWLGRGISAVKPA